VPIDEADRAARLLLKALDSLSERDRRYVLRALLSARIAVLGASAPTHADVPPHVGELGFGPQVTRQVDQPLLVRLPSALHRRFRRWATDHGFSMAAVVRGLIERFLDEEAARGSPG
jgi:hypothetical protein